MSAKTTPPGAARRGNAGPQVTVRGMDTGTVEGSPGTLFVVATPIGNLDDLSPRALDVLRRVPWIACEDTRAARRLRTRFGFAARLVSCHDHNEARQVDFLLQRLRAGEDLALICDAGTPLISDPGYRVVRAARTEGLPVRTVAGPSAVASALSVAGLPTDTFTFFGFPPGRRGAKRRAYVERAAAAPGSLVFFESARRTGSFLGELAEVLGAREASVSREMTKIHEDHWFGPLPELARRAESEPLRGEVTIVVAPAGRGRRQPT